VSINGSPLEATVPGGRSPDVLLHEGVRLVIASEEQLDAIQITDEGVLLGVIGFDESGGPIASPGGKKYTHLMPDGKPVERTAESVSRRGTPSRQIGVAWEMADTQEYVTGSSPRYAAITGPASLSSLGAPYGYGWYRMRFRSSVAKRVRIAAPQAADRLSVLLDGEQWGVFGRGPGAAGGLTLELNKDDQTLVT